MLKKNPSLKFQGQFLEKLITEKNLFITQKMLCFNFTNFKKLCKKKRFFFFAQLIFFITFAFSEHNFLFMSFIQGFYIKKFAHSFGLLSSF